MATTDAPAAATLFTAETLPAYLEARAADIGVFPAGASLTATASA